MRVPACPRFQSHSFVPSPIPYIAYLPSLDIPHTDTAQASGMAEFIKLAVIALIIGESAVHKEVVHMAKCPDESADIPPDGQSNHEHITCGDEEPCLRSNNVPMLLHVFGSYDW